jgi:hypothetical protein
VQFLDGLKDDRDHAILARIRNIHLGKLLSGLYLAFKDHWLSSQSPVGDLHTESRGIHCHLEWHPHAL